jgi:Cys-tRNA(Pro) deacylase
MTNATRELQDCKVAYRLFHHTGPVESLEQAAEQRGQQPGQIVRTIVFRLETGEFVLVLIAGPSQLSWPALRRTLGQRRIRLATPAEVHTATGYLPGAVSPFGLPAPLRILVDRSVLLYEEISLGSGERGVAIVMLTADLLRILRMPPRSMDGVEIGTWGE